MDLCSVFFISSAASVWILHFCFGPFLCKLVFKPVLALSLFFFSSVVLLLTLTAQEGRAAGGVKGHLTITN